MDEFLKNLTDEQKKALIDALNKQEETKSQKASVNDDFTVKRTSNNQRRKEPVKARKNEWRDDGEFRDIETPKVDRVARNRPPHKKTEVECSVCGKSFKVDPKYVYGEYHRCSRCVGR